MKSALRFCCTWCHSLLSRELHSQQKDACSGHLLRTPHKTCLSHIRAACPPSSPGRHSISQLSEMFFSMLAHILQMSVPVSEQNPAILIAAACSCSEQSLLPQHITLSITGGQGGTGRMFLNVRRAWQHQRDCSPWRHCPDVHQLPWQARSYPHSVRSLLCSYSFLPFAPQIFLFKPQRPLLVA